MASCQCTLGAPIQWCDIGVRCCCCRYLADNLDWLEEHLSIFGDEDYLLIDCPGQIELYSHIPVMKRVLALFQREGFNVCAVYLVRASGPLLLVLLDCAVARLGVVLQHAHILQG